MISVYSLNFALANQFEVIVSRRLYVDIPMKPNVYHFSFCKADLTLTFKQNEQHYYGRRLDAVGNKRQS